MSSGRAISIMAVTFLAALTALAYVLPFSKIVQGAVSPEFAGLTRNSRIGRPYAGSQARRKIRSDRAGEITMTQEKLVAVPASVWGATGIQLNVEGGGVKIEYSCAAGEIDKPLKMDTAGKFRADGVHIRLHGGPVRADDPPERVPAVYEGRIKDKAMTLKVILKDTKEVIGEYSLTRDKTPRLHRCL